MKRILPIILSVLFAVDGCKKEYSSIDELCKDLAEKCIVVDSKLSDGEEYIQSTCTNILSNKDLSKDGQLFKMVSQIVNDDDITEESAGIALMTEVIAREYTQVKIIREEPNKSLIEEYLGKFKEFVKETRTSLSFSTCSNFYFQGRTRSMIRNITGNMNLVADFIAENIILDYKQLHRVVLQFNPQIRKISFNLTGYPSGNMTLSFPMVEYITYINDSNKYGITYRGGLQIHHNDPSYAGDILYKDLYLFFKKDKELPISYSPAFKEALNKQ